MFIFRHITKEDLHFNFITGNEIFDEFASDGTLENYITQDAITGGNYLTYLLIESLESGDELLGLLRFRYTTVEEFMMELSLTSVLESTKKNVETLLALKKYRVVYLSRIGVSINYHEMRISQIISNFFEFLIQREKQDILIFAKVLENLTSIVGSKYRVLGKKDDEKWGNYCLVSKIVEFFPIKE